MKIAVIHDYADVFRRTRAYPRLQEHEVIIHTEASTDPARVIAQAAGCDALLLTQQRVPLSRQIIEHLPGLRFISQTGRNTNHLDIPACTQQGIVVSAGGGGGGGSPYSTTAELTWGLILASLRHLPYEVERLKQGHWQSTVGTRLFGRTLGVYAFGHIGAAVARVGKAFGMHVVCWGREGSTARARAEGFEIAASRAAFFENADVLSLHLPGNHETRGIVTADDLARMKPTALLVNTSRAPIIADGALVAALQQGRPGFAAVDVYEDRAGRRRGASIAADAECPVHPAPGLCRARQLRSPLHCGGRPVARLRCGATDQCGESGGQIHGEKIMIKRRTFMSLVATAAVAPDVSWPQGGSGKVALYASVGPTLTHYDVDVPGAELSRRSAVTLPANVQYVWPHASRQYLYVASSNSAPGLGGVVGDQHHVSAFRIDAAGALTPHGQPIPLPSRPIHLTTDIPSEHVLVAFNNPSALRVYRINRDATLGEAVPQPGAIERGYLRIRCA